jgi:hypothetical protein
MIKTLRITSVLVAMGAMALLGFSVVYGIEKDPEVQALVDSDGPVAQFEQNQGRTAAQKNVNTKHPLVVAAEKYALLLNPPKAAPRVSPKRNLATNKIKASVAKNISSSTKLVGTCFNAEDPNLSFALVDTPGKGQRWISLKDKIDHHTVHEILAGEVVLLNGDQRQVLTVEKKATLSLIKGENKGLPRPVAVKSVDINSKPSRANPVRRPSLAKRPVLRPPTRTSPLRSVNSVTTEERAQIFDRALAQAQEMQVDVPSMSAEEQEMERVRREKVMAAILAAKDKQNLKSEKGSNQLRELGKAFFDRQADSDMNEL